MRAIILALFNNLLAEALAAKNLGEDGALF
jgi:hypothetical protein